MNYTKEDKEKNVKEMLKMIGENPDREGLKDTPKRVVKMWEELFRGYDEKQKPKVTVFKNGYDGILVDQMISDTGNFYSNCEHHGLPFIGKYWFAYIPNTKGKILGLSKVARVVNFHSAKLQVQERLVKNILDNLYNALVDNSIGPVGMGLVLEAEHLCKTMRGVKKKGMMRTVELIGQFKDDITVKTEFLDWVNTTK